MVPLVCIRCESLFLLVVLVDLVFLVRPCFDAPGDLESLLTLGNRILAGWYAFVRRNDRDVACRASLLELVVVDTIRFAR